MRGMGVLFRKFCCAAGVAHTPYNNKTKGRFFSPYAVGRKTKMIRKLLCRLGFHVWRRGIVYDFCRYCKKRREV
jgi:hypothetical protein